MQAPANPPDEGELDYIIVADSWIPAIQCLSARPPEQPRGVGRPVASLAGLWRNGSADDPIVGDGRHWYVWAADATGVGRRRTTLPRAAAAQARDARGNFNITRFSVTYPSHQHPIDSAGANLYVAFGMDHRREQCLIVRRAGPQLDAAVEFLHTKEDCVQGGCFDGAFLQHSNALSSKHCPLCARMEKDYMHDPSARTINQCIGFIYEYFGVGFIHVFAHPFNPFRRIFTPTRMPAWAIVWGPLHCWSNSLAHLVHDTLDLLDYYRPGTSLTWAAAFTTESALSSQYVVDRGTDFSFDDLRDVWAARDALPRTTIPLLDLYWDTFMRGFTIWHHCVNAALFRDVMKQLRRLHLVLFRRMRPSQHAIIDHLPAQWLRSGVRQFPLIFSDEGPEKAHDGHRRRYCDGSRYRDHRHPPRPMPNADHGPPGPSPDRHAGQETST